MLLMLFRKRQAAVIPIVPSVPVAAIDATTILVQQFRADYPEFASSTQFQTSTIAYWLEIAGNMVSVQRWGKLYTVGVELYAAHNIVIEARAFAEAANGGMPGSQVGPLNSKSVDKVSAGYDTGAGAQADAGHWNTTIYGTRFIRMARMFGAGPVHLGVGIAPAGSGPAWSGPSVLPGMNNFGN